MITDYTHNLLLNKDTESEFFGQKIITKIINGYIYRGDEHTNLVLSKSPKFYGTKESALEYTENRKYLKRYKTITPLRLLNLSPENNIENIHNFFKNFLIDHPTLLNKQLDIKISFIVLQVMFGLINNNKVDKVGMAQEDIIKYFKNKNISDSNSRIFLFIINRLLKRKIPSRCSIRSIDKMLMINLKNILAFMNIDGIYYINNDVKDNNLLCKFVNIFYGKGADTCTPTEICIFDPANKLGGVIMWQKTNNKLIPLNKNNKYNRYIRHNYNRLSLNDLYKMSKK